MNIALHFNSDDEIFEGFYGEPIYEEVFKKILGNSSLTLTSNIRVGDLILNQEFGFGGENEIFVEWIESSGDVWSKFIPARVLDIINKNIFVVCFSNISWEHTNILYNELFDYQPFIGAMEINYEYPVFEELYKVYLLEFGKINGSNLSLFYKDIDGEDQDESLRQFLESIGFDEVTWEFYNS